MPRALSAAVSVLLLAVLSGAPAIAVICAEWCAGGGQGTSAHQSHGERVHPSPDSVMECHGPVGGAGTISGLAERDCVDHGAAIAGPSVIGGRIDASQLLAADWVQEALPLAASGVTRVRIARTGHAPPPRSLPSIRVLRI